MYCLLVLQYSSKNWTTMLSLSDWFFKPLTYNHFQFPPTLHVGDYDMDGFPDVLTILSSRTSVLLLLMSLLALMVHFTDTKT